MERTGLSKCGLSVVSEVLSSSPIETHSITEVKLGQRKREDGLEVKKSRT